MEFFTLNLFIKLYSLKVKKGSDSENKSFLSKLEPVNSKLIVSLRPVCSSAYTLIFPESPKLWRYGSNPRSKRPEKKNYHPIILYNLSRVAIMCGFPQIWRVLDPLVGEKNWCAGWRVLT